jgi:hypothetical protein
LPRVSARGTRTIYLKLEPEAPHLGNTSIVIAHRHDVSDLQTV